MEEEEKGGSPQIPKVEVLPHPQEDASLLEELKAKQYWREEWRTEANTESTFDLGDPSTLGPSLSQVAAKAREARYGVAPTVQEVASCSKLQNVGYKLMNVDSVISTKKTWCERSSWPFKVEII